MTVDLAHVILSGAKNPRPSVDRPGTLEILRSAQNDRAKPLFHGLLMSVRSTDVCPLK